MADIFDKHTKRILKSVDTSEYLPNGKYYEADRYIIAPTFVPGCESKYIFVEADNTIREMTQLEKDAVDYVAPPHPPTAEEIEATRKQNVQTEIRKSYPEHTDEFEEIRKILATEFPGNARAQAYNTTVEAAKAKYPKV
ncbi:MAG: hypothetical protein KAJ03_01735 [Gammaproteobacteria bacterium]|nr:hypothetical protein [Gammaproteobacteria bacterium]